MSENREALYTSLQRVLDHWDKNSTLIDTGDPFVGYDGPYRDKAVIDGLISFYSAVGEAVSATPNTVGCDLGCWLGFSSLMLAQLTGARVYGVDIQDQFETLTTDWLSKVEVENLSFSTIKNSAVPLPSASMDWVLVNQVLCNALPNSFEGSIREAVRILKPNGALIISDSNNPYCPAVIERLTKRFKAAEIGDGNAASPAGTVFESRKAYLANIDANLLSTGLCVASLTPVELNKLTRDTAYMSGRDLESALVEFKQTGKTPQSRFIEDVERSPIEPDTGAALGNITNPFSILNMVENLGLKAHIATSLTWTEYDPQTLYELLSQSGGFYIMAKAG